MDRLDARARERFFTNTAPDWEDESEEDGSKKKKRRSKERRPLPKTATGQLEAHIQRVLALIETKWPPSTRAIDGPSVYTGAAGVALLYLRLHTFESASSSSSSGASKHLATSLAYVQTALQLTRSRNKRQPDRKKGISFVTGEAGVYAVAAAVYHALGRGHKSQRYVDKLEAISTQFVPVNDSWGEWELLYGCAGYMYALHFVKKYTGKDIAAPLLSRLVPAALSYGKRYAGRLPGDHKSRPPLMYAWHEKEYFAVAHGLSGILMILLMQPDLLDDWKDEGKSGRALVEETIDWLLTTKLPSGNYPTRLNADGDRLVQWCHGAPAIGLLLHRAYEVYGKDTYLREAMSISDVVWARGLLKKGVGLCHGISGNAYLFLYLFRATGDEKYLYRAWTFAEFSMSDRCAKETWDKPDEPYCLFNGLAGSVWFCSDLLRAASAKQQQASALDSIFFPACDLA